MTSRTTHADAQARIKASRKGKATGTAAIPKGSAFAIPGTPEQIKAQAKATTGKTATGKVQKFEPMAGLPVRKRGKK